MNKRKENIFLSLERNGENSLDLRLITSKQTTIAYHHVQELRRKKPRNFDSRYEELRSFKIHYLLYSELVFVKEAFY